MAAHRLLPRLRRRLPVDETTRAWVEGSLAELAALFGPAAEWPTIVPTAEYFPEHFAGSVADTRSLVERVCGWFRIDPVEIDIEMFADPADADDDDPRPVLPFMTAGVRGDYVPTGDGRGLIGIHRSDLSDPLVLVATIAHELAHHLLIAHKHIAPTRPDNEGLTDLLTTHLGLGIIAANAQRQYRRHLDGSWSSTTLGYLSAQTYGYALAIRAMTLHEPDPAWDKHLARNPRHYLRTSLKVLSREDRT